MAEKILLVDDEPNVLQSMKRQLRKRFTVMTAQSGDKALEILKDHGPFAVIISDMRMPGMDGVQLLSRVKDSFPDTVRIMLTGNADQETATKAVNEGQIFRFLTKPCSTAVMVKSLVFAMRQYNLISAEKELLNKTLKSSITVMAELLSLANATAFSSGYRIRPLVKHLATELQLPHLWQYEVAALMSQIGCISLPTDILHRLHAGITLSEEEQQMYKNHPQVASGLIQKIPRLEKVAAMIEHQLCPFDCRDGESFVDEEIRLGSEILKVAVDYDLLRQQDLNHILAIKSMRKQKEMYNQVILDLMEKHKPKEMHTTIINVSFKDVIPGMIAAEDVFAKNGTLLIPKDQEITWSIIKSLGNFEKHIGIMEPIRVRLDDRKEQDLLSLEA